MATFAENVFLMMTRKEVAEVITFCKKNDISYKTRLAELGIPGERAIRPLALGRRNWLFCDNDASAYRAATAC